MPEPPVLPPIQSAPVSVVLLAHNDRPHLESVVSSWVTFLNTLGRERQLLLVDAGSTDGTPELFPALAAQFPQSLELVPAPQRPGHGAALQAALPRVLHPLVCYVRTDPRYSPGDLKRFLTETDKQGRIIMDHVHLRPGYRAGMPVPPFWQSVGAVYRGFWKYVLSHGLEPLPGWLGFRRHLGVWLSWFFFGTMNRDVACPYRVFRRELLERVGIQSDGTFAHVEFLAKVHFLGPGGVIAEEMPLGTKQNPCPPDDRDSEPLARVLREGWRVFNHPRFGSMFPPPEPPAELTPAPESPPPQTPGTEPLTDPGGAI